MKNTYVAMGTYYRADQYGLVRTVCRATDVKTGEVITAYVEVGEGGCVGEVMLMPELEFEQIFLRA